VCKEETKSCITTKKTTIIDKNDKIISCVGQAGTNNTEHKDTERHFSVNTMDNYMTDATQSNNNSSQVKNDCSTVTKLIN